MASIKTPYNGLRRRHDTAVFERAELSNGIVVWRQKPPILLTDQGILVAFFPRVGSVLDPSGKEGLAHFFEHVPFKGTKLHPSNKEITEEVRSRGGEDNAATAPFWTDYHISMPERYYADAAGLVHELITQPLLRPEDIETERGVIMSEYERTFSKGENRAYRDIHAILFKGHPLARFGIGTREGIAGVTPTDIHDFQHAYYHAGNLQIIIGGAFADRPDALLELEKLFGSFARGADPAPALQLLPAHRAGEAEFRDKRYGRDMLSLDWLLPPLPTADLAALQLLMTALARGSDAPLVLELRDRLGLTYETHLSHLERTVCGSWMHFMLPVPADRFDEMDSIFKTTLRNLSEADITKVLGRSQLDRLSDFTGPISTCLLVPDEVVIEGRPRSYTEEESEEDAIDMAAVQKWKTFLLETPPFTSRVIAQE